MTIKDKLPDLKDVSIIAKKLYSDVKQSVREIIQDYKTKKTISVPSSASANPTPNTTTQQVANTANTGKPTVTPSEEAKKEKETVS